MDDIRKDERFKHIPTDSRFKEMHKKDRKFKVDNRFKKMFHDKSFKLKYSVDKRGRPVNLTTNDNLKKFYELSSDSESEESDKETETDKKEKPDSSSDKAEDLKPSSSSEDSENDDEVSGKDMSEEEAAKTESSAESSEDSSDDEDSSSDESGIHEDSEIPWNEFDKETERNDQISRRLAMCNMDWDRMKATDLFVLINSFKPTNSVIKSVKIYLSDYGRERIEYETLHGPKELTETKEGDDVKSKENKKSHVEKPHFEHGDDDDDGDNINRDKLRTYQFNRLRYYYAVVECDNEETANKIYTECDGMEYESSCTRLDLRFIPDDTEFDEEPKDACSEHPDPLTYKPNLFFTTALNQTKVECTWDETPRDRLAITMKKYTEDDIKNNTSFKKILASSESENEDDDEETKAGSQANDVSDSNKDEDSDEDENEDEEEKKMRTYRNLLLGLDEKSKSKRESGLEFNWGDGVEDSAGSDDDDDLLVNNKKKAEEPNAKSSKKGKKKPMTEEELNEQAQLSMLTMDNDEKPHFNLDDLLVENKKSKKSKKKNRMLEEKEKAMKEDDFKLNVTDPRFAAIFDNHKFNIDPSDQLFKKTKAMETLMEEKNKRKIAEVDELENSSNKPDNEESVAKKAKVDSGASLLISSIKSKTEILNRRKKEAKERQNKIKFNIKK